MQNSVQTFTEHRDDSDVLTLNSPVYHLIVWNDDINTFDWVTRTLIEICKHEKEQAEQCTMFIHYKGKYTVKEGDYDTLKAMCTGITDRGIGATVEESVC